jgi:hypothetical protein
MLSRTLIDLYRCPEESGSYLPGVKPSSPTGYFTFGEELICYGRCALGAPSPNPTGRLCNAAEAISVENGIPRLPFDLDEVIDNLRLERYASSDQVGNLFSRVAGKVVRKMYYGVRPHLSVGIRGPIQRAYLRGRDRRPFPRWPVDCSADEILEKLLSILMKSKGPGSIPFIWFWPDAASSCAILTHDIETVAGRDFCFPLMDIDDQYGMKASFQIVPEQRYNVRDADLEAIRRRGFEINIQDLNHDGQLYASRAEFLRRAKLINEYGRKYKAFGFRSAVLYREPDWFDALEFSFDMSIPNTAHMDPQAGGCCSVFPYFIGDILEIPVTTIQDYSLFHILREYSIDLWRRQLDLILKAHGLASFIVHPDYIIDSRAREVYMQLLKYLGSLSRERNVWLALPGEVNRWWRERSRMRLVRGNGAWHIEGAGKDRARIAWARLDTEGKVRYSNASDMPRQNCTASPTLQTPEELF